MPIIVLQSRTFLVMFIVLARTATGIVMIPLPFLRVELAGRHLPEYLRSLHDLRLFPHVVLRWYVRTGDVALRMGKNSDRGRPELLYRSGSALRLCSISKNAVLVMDEFAEPYGITMSITSKSP